MAKDKIRISITRAEAADRLEQIALSCVVVRFRWVDPRLMSRTKLNSKAKRNQTNSSLRSSGDEPKRQGERLEIYLHFCGRAKLKKTKAGETKKVQPPDHESNGPPR